MTHQMLAKRQQIANYFTYIFLDLILDIYFVLKWKIKRFLSKLIVPLIKLI